MIRVVLIEYVSNASYEVGSSWVRRDVFGLRFALVILRLYQGGVIQWVLLWYAYDENGWWLGNGVRDTLRNIRMLPVYDDVQVFGVGPKGSSGGLLAERSG